MCTGTPFCLMQHKVILTPDASLWVGGGPCEGLTVQGKWLSQEKKLYINALELRVIRHALNSFSDIVKEAWF